MAKKENLPLPPMYHASSLAKKNLVEAQDTNTRKQVTIYSDKDLLDNVKILANEEIDFITLKHYYIM